MMTPPNDARPVRTGQRFLTGLLLLLGLTAVACGRDPAASASPVVPSPPPSLVATVQPQATATAPAPPAATATLITPTIVASPVAQAVCDFAYFFDPAPDSCPAGAPSNSAAAEQPFERGLMIWLQQTDSVIVFYDDGRWVRFEDTWSEGDAESDPSLAPPEGRFQPIRGFGKVWRQRPAVRQALGWALGVELGFESTLQERANSADQPQLTYLRTFNGQVIALVQRDQDQGDWVLAADNR